MDFSPANTPCTDTIFPVNSKAPLTPLANKLSEVCQMDTSHDQVSQTKSSKDLVNSLTLPQSDPIQVENSAIKFPRELSRTNSTRPKILNINSATHKNAKITNLIKEEKQTSSILRYQHLPTQ